MDEIKKLYETAAVDDDELDAVAGGFDNEGRPDSIQDWYLLACEVNKYGRDYVKGAENVAEKYNLEPSEVLDNWFWFVTHAKDALK